MSEHDINYIKSVAAKMLQQGFRVFIAERGTYGFYTDDLGTKVISFQSDGCRFSMSGNYVTDSPARTGTGWQITERDPGDYRQAFNAYPPQWAVGGAKWRFATLQDHLDRYMDSSKYQEVEIDANQ